MADIKDYIVTEDTSIVDTIKTINSGGKTIAFVCKDNKLIAVVSDGDVRRYIIDNGNLDNDVSKIANYSPIYVYKDEDVDYEKYMRQKSIQALPIVDRSMNILDIQFLSKTEEHHKENIGIPVVMMAGGKGTRLKPYTEVLPKPLIPIGDKTIT